MEMAVKLAKLNNVNEDDARFAGLMHDCAKCKTQFEMIEIVRHKIKDMDPMEIRTEKILHAPVSAYVARDGFGIKDADILSAIRWHTIGKVGMSDFEKIIFLADKIENRTRELEFREKIEKALNKNNSLDDAMFKSFKMTIKSLVKRKLPICFQTIEVYNDLLTKIS